MNFSQRNGFAPIKKQLQIDDMDDELRNGLWNVIDITFFHCLDRNPFFPDTINDEKLVYSLWLNKYKLRLDSIPQGTYIKEHIIKEFNNYKWNQIFDFIEFLIQFSLAEPSYAYRNFTKECNIILERENSAYRIINNQFIPITNEIEIDAISRAIKETVQFTAIEGANKHLSTALKYLSDRKEPDYRNSIKESISAVENIAAIISRSKGDSLGKALSNISKEIKIHEALIRGYKSIYGYTSEADGIRHCMVEEENCEYEDALYMLVSCSAFINYLISKANKANIDLKTISD